MTPRTEIGRDKLKAYVKRVGTSITAGYNCATSSLGDLGCITHCASCALPAARISLITGLNNAGSASGCGIRRVSNRSNTTRRRMLLVIAGSGRWLLDDTMPTYPRRIRRRRRDDAIVAGLVEFPPAPAVRTTTTAPDARAASTIVVARKEIPARAERVAAARQHGGASRIETTRSRRRLWRRSRRLRWRKRSPLDVRRLRNSAHALERARRPKSSAADNVEFIDPDASPLPVAPRRI
jgi:hypothetical protein